MRQTGRPGRRQPDWLASLPAMVAAGGILLAVLAPRAARARPPELPNGEVYGTLPRGQVELDGALLWTGLDGWTLDAPPARQLWLGMTYGITSRWEVAFEDDLAPVDHGGTRYEGWYLATRYRFADPGRWPVDLMLTVDFGNGPEVPTYGVRADLVLEKDLGRFALVGNLAIVWPITSEVLPAGGLGVVYRPAPALSLGLGVWRQPWSYPDWYPTIDGPRPGLVYVGPSVAVTHGGLWVRLAFSFALDPAAARAAAPWLRQARIELTSGYAL